MSNFEKFQLEPWLLESILKIGFQTPTEIQEEAIPILLKEPCDFIALASTGSGKTAAFAIPLMQKLNFKVSHPQALVLSPTRELAQQVADDLDKLGKAAKVSVASIYGGASYQTQKEKIKRGVHVVVATPGRLRDLIEQGSIKLNQIDVLVLDEADKMLSMGFQEELEFILKATHPDLSKEDLAKSGNNSSKGRAHCKTWLFSATMNSEVKTLTRKYLNEPKIIQINRGQGLSPTIEHKYLTVKIEFKTEVIKRFLQSISEFYGIIFCQTKVEVSVLEDELMRLGFNVESLHGDKTQKEREHTLKRFKSGQTKVLVATDVAARGLDVKNLGFVINHSIPREAETYIHRVGRTGRNGQTGIAVTLISPDQVSRLAKIKKMTGIQLEKGTVPDNKEMASKKIFEMVSKLKDAGKSSEKYERAMDWVIDWLKQNENFESEGPADLLARWLMLTSPSLFNDRENNMDFMFGKVPRELSDNPQADSGGFERRRSSSRPMRSRDGSERRFDDNRRRDDRRDDNRRGDRREDSRGDRRDDNRNDRPSSPSAARSAGAFDGVRRNRFKKDKGAYSKHAAGRSL